MTCAPGVEYPYGTTHQPDEHALELLPRHLAEWQALTDRLGDNPVRTVCDDFILEPLGS
jgi:hypothetical protein